MTMPTPNEPRSAEIARNTALNLVGKLSENSYLSNTSDSGKNNAAGNAPLRDVYSQLTDDDKRHITMGDVHSVLYALRKANALSAAQKPSDAAGKPTRLKEFLNGRLPCSSLEQELIDFAFWQERELNASAPAPSSDALAVAIEALEKIARLSIDGSSVQLMAKKALAKLRSAAAKGEE